MISQAPKIIIVLVNTSLRVRILATADEVKEGFQSPRADLSQQGLGPGK